MNNLNAFSQIEILDVLDFERSKIDYSTPKRNFNVLSIRVFGKAKFIQNNETITVCSKNAVFIPENIEYSQSTEGERVIAIHFMGNTPSKKITAFTIDDHIRNLFFDVAKLWQAKDTKGFYISHSRLYDILSHINNIDVENTLNDKITLGYEEINMRFKDPELKIDDIAHRNGMSAVYFRREFKKRYNISPKKRIILLRLNNASALLRNGYCSVAEAAIQSGFSDPNYFSTVFKCHFGLPPRKYSKNS